MTEFIVKLGHMTFAGYGLAFMAVQDSWPVSLLGLTCFTLNALRLVLFD